jgi:hypothetical protein
VPVLIVEQLHLEVCAGIRNKDPNEKRDILEQILAIIPVGWEKLFSALSKEEDPHQLLLLIAELNRVFEERRAQVKKPDGNR